MFTAIFDLDGTLVDTMQDLRIAGNLTYQELGWKVRLNSDFHNGIAISGGRSMIRHGFQSEGLEFTDADVDKLYPTLLKNYNDTIDKNSFLYDGILDVLITLRQLGWGVGLCTNKPELQANVLLEKLGVRSYFKSFIGADTVGVAKPNPKPLISAIHGAGGTLEKSVLVGDTKTDRDTALAAGVKCLLVGYGHGALVYDLADLKPEALVNEPHELPEALETLLRQT